MSDDANVDLGEERRIAHECAQRWGLELGPPFALSNVSFVAPTNDGTVIKVSWLGDDESLHEPDALAVWEGNGAVRILRRMDRVLLLERLVPGDDIAQLDDDEATPLAIDLAKRLWRPAQAPFRPVAPEVRKWLDRAEQQGGVLVPLARELFAEVGDRADWLVHGDFHHHNILRAGSGYLAIDPKPFLADREYDVASFLWNPMGNDFSDVARTERRINYFVKAGLDDFLIRAWTVIRGSYLRSSPPFVDGLRALVR